MPNSIGTQIKDARKQRKMSQDDLALIMHVSRGAISHWETGHTLPDDKTIAELEQILQCKFETEQVQAEEPADHAVETPAKKQMCKTIRVFNLEIPIWLCSAIAGVIIVAMLVILLNPNVNLQKQFNDSSQLTAMTSSPAGEQETEEQEKEEAYLTIIIDQDPVKGGPDPFGSDKKLWIYNVSIVEHNGVAFTVEEMTMIHYNGDLLLGSNTDDAEKLASEWGSNTIPAHGVQRFGSGMPVQAVTHSEIVIKGVDAKGNHLQFPGIINYSQEIAE